MRATFKAGASGARITQTWLGHAAARGNPWDFDGGQVQLRFSGRPDGVVEPGGLVTSDWISANIRDSRALVSRTAFAGNSSVARAGASRLDLRYLSKEGAHAGALAPPGFAEHASESIWIESVEVLRDLGTGIHDCLAGPPPWPLPANPNDQPVYLEDVARVDDWTASNVREGAVHVLGDSIAAFGDWRQTGLPVFNCGVGGEKVQGLLNRVRKIPSLRFACGTILLPPTNNINDGTDLDQLVRWWGELMRWVSGPMIAICAFYQATSDRRARIDVFNAALHGMAWRRGDCAVVDLNAEIAADGVLPRSYLRDEIHLSRAGYEALYAQIKAAWRWSTPGSG